MNINNVLRSNQLNSSLKPNFESKSNYNYSLEGLRGLAALSVGLAHVSGFKNVLDPSYNVPKPLQYLNSGMGAVLIFFILSGYVIGLTNTKDFSYRKTIEYLFRRVVRLVPIYWIAIIISIIILPGGDFQNIVGNLFFLQNSFVTPLLNNEIVWTINYEVVYYLLFLFIWALQPKVLNLLFCCLGISIIGWFFPEMPMPGILFNYACGWIFWLLGLWLVWKIKPRESSSIKIPLVSYILLVIATDHLNIGTVLLYGLGFVNNAPGIVNLSDLSFLPICFLLFIEVTNRRFKGYKILIYLSLLLPILNVMMLLLMGRIFENTSWVVSEICLLLALVLWNFKLSINILTKLAPFGRISYAFYLLHMPMMKLVHDYFPYEGTALSFALRFVLWMLITIGVSVLLELVMQPVIKKFCYQQFIPKKV